MFSLSRHIATCINPTPTMDYLIQDEGNCVGVIRRSWGIPSLGGSAYEAWDRVPQGEMHYTHPLDVPEGAICYGLNGQHGQRRTRYGHAWVASTGLKGWTTDYVQMGTFKLAPMSLPRWTGDTEVQWTSWTQYGRLPVGRTQRQRNGGSTPVTPAYRQGKRVFASKMHQGQMNSDSVWNVVLALKARGAKIPYGDDYTWAVFTAVRNFQKSRGWTGKGADGIVGPMTAAALKLVWVND